MRKSRSKKPHRPDTLEVRPNSGSEFSGTEAAKPPTREGPIRERKPIEKFVTTHEKKPRAAPLKRMNFRHREALETYRFLLKSSKNAEPLVEDTEEGEEGLSTFEV